MESRSLPARGARVEIPNAFPSFRNLLIVAPRKGSEG